MSTEYIDIEGMDKVEKWLEEYPKAMKNLIKSAMRRAAKPELARSNGALQYRVQEAESKLKIYTRKDNILLSLGLFGNSSNSNSIGKGVTDKMAWYKAYWINYGTLSGRDPNHKFKSGVRKGSKTKQDFGVMHENFYELAMVGAAERIAKEMMDTVLNSIAKAEKELNNG